MFSRPDPYWARAAVSALVLLVSGGALVAAQSPGASFVFSADDIAGPQFAARSVHLAFDAKGALDAEIGQLTVLGRTWTKVRLTCSRPRFDASTIACAEGTLDAGKKLPVSFAYERARSALRVAVHPAKEETWRLSAQWGGKRQSFDLKVVNGNPAHFAGSIPENWPRINKGTMSGSFHYDASSKRGDGELKLAGLAFSDEGGLHAGENVGADIKIELRHEDPGWSWKANLEWREGEVFWQPLYFKAGGNALQLRGSTEGRYSVIDARALWPALGEAMLHGRWDQQERTWVEASVDTGRLPVEALYAQVLKPYFEGTAFDDLRAEGEVEVSAALRDGAINAVNLAFNRVSFEDRRRRFALFGLDGHIPWRSAAPSSATLKISGGELLRLPFGGFDLPLAMEGTRLEISALQIPLLDGRLTLGEFLAVGAEKAWRWQMSGELSAVSMERLAQSLGLPVMHGTLSASVPKAIYAGSTLSVDGALLFKVFGGTIVAQNLRISEPFGKVPHLEADLDMRSLDLDLLTRTFSFGNVTGRVDATVAGLELANWRPVRFDARVASSAGDYPREISQKAVENISALGGAGAAVAVQRSFLRFFERFRYEKLGLGCMLRNSICTMSGIEDLPQGYVIVKGGGIPAISVIGYNRRVDWQELVDRLGRIVQENVRAIVK